MFVNIQNLSMLQLHNLFQHKWYRKIKILSAQVFMTHADSLWGGSNIQFLRTDQSVYCRHIKFCPDWRPIHIIYSRKDMCWKWKYLALHTHCTYDRSKYFVVCRCKFSILIVQFHDFKSRYSTKLVKFQESVTLRHFRSFFFFRYLTNFRASTVPRNI